MVVEHKIIGHDMQSVEITLKPKEGIIAEAHTLLLLEDGITYEARMGDGTAKKGNFMKAFGRAITGAGVFLTHFENTHSTNSRKVAFTANCPGKILPIHLSAWKNHSINVEHNGFLCATKGTVVDTKRTKRIKAGMFGGAGFFLQHLHNTKDPSNATVFLHCCGSVMTRTLEPGEVLKVDPGAVVAFEDGVDFSIAKAGNLTTMIFGGDIFLATLKGPGRVILQSLPWGKVVNSIVREAQN